MPQPISPDHGLQPMDEYNRILVSHVHPPDWRPPKPADRYHLVVIGAGTAGLVTAAGAAGLGAKVALVERHLMGGDCLNTGCVPSKCLIHSARAYAQGRAYGETGTDLPEGAREGLTVSRPYFTAGTAQLLVKMIDVNKNNAIIEDCYFLGASTSTFLVQCFISIATTFDNTIIRRCEFFQGTAPAGSDGAADTGVIYMEDSENVTVRGFDVERQVAAGVPGRGNGTARSPESNSHARSPEKR